jgi:tetratricopeptide (TPR) repeat protein
MAASDAFDPRACPDVERLAAYIDDALGPVDRAELERHLVDCADCRLVIHETVVFSGRGIADDSRRRSSVMHFRQRRWVIRTAIGLSAAATLILFTRIALPGWWGSIRFRNDRPELQELIGALESAATRPVEGRLTGNFKYAPAPSPTRGGLGESITTRVRLTMIELDKRAREENTTANRAALGVAYAAVGDLDRAVAELERLVADAPQDGRYASDLSAVYLTRAARTGVPDDYLKALDAAERALRVNPTLIEGQFNRALALERLERRDQARAAWNELLRIDHAQGWAAEDRQHLDDLGQKTPVEISQPNR